MCFKCFPGIEKKNTTWLQFLFILFLWKYSPLFLFALTECLHLLYIGTKSRKTERKKNRRRKRTADDSKDTNWNNKAKKTMPMEREKEKWKEWEGKNGQWNWKRCFLLKEPSSCKRVKYKLFVPGSRTWSSFVNWKYYQMCHDSVNGKLNKTRN